LCGVNWDQTPISLGFNDAPVLVGHGELEHGLGKIDRNGSSIHVGLLTFDEDLIPTPMKTSALISRKQTGESIPSFEPTRTGVRRSAVISFWANRHPPVRAAQLKRLAPQATGRALAPVTIAQ
jgi:hypothetical protein